MRHIFEDFFAVPAVVAAGEDVDAVVKQFVGQSRGDAEAGGGVFAVGDDQVDLPLRDDVGQAIADDLASWRADDVTDEEYAHAGCTVEGGWWNGITGLSGAAHGL